ncbi:MAG: type II toxin-antitoxin system RelE/ParE family toxin [Ferruginibacter sp.]
MQDETAAFFYGPKIIAFLESLDEGALEKTEWTPELIRTADTIPVRFLKHIEGTRGLYEIRVTFSGEAYRLFCFFSQENSIVVISGFKK